MAQWQPAVRLSDEILASLKDPEVLKKMRALGFDPRPAGPEAFAALLRAEMTKVGNVVKGSRISAGIAGCCPLHIRACRARCDTGGGTTLPRIRPG